MAIAEITTQRDMTTHGSGTSIVLTLPSAPSAGHLVVLGLAWRDNRTVTAVPHSCQLASNGGDGSGIDSAIYYKIADGTEGTDWTFTISGSAKSVGIATVFSGVLGASPLDKANSNTGTGTAGTTGTTGTLAQADEVAICLFGNASNSTWASFDNSQTLVGQDTATGGGSAGHCNAALTQRIVSATTAVNYGATLSGSQIWSTAVATFKAAAAAAGSSMKVWNGSSWVLKPVKRWNGSAWVDATVKRWNGSAWVSI